MGKCLVKYKTACFTLPWSMETGHWVIISFSLINVINAIKAMLFPGYITNPLTFPKLKNILPHGSP